MNHLSFDNKAFLSKCKKLGRTYMEDIDFCFDWSASGFAVSFIGEAIYLHFGEYKDAMPAYLRIDIDGQIRQKHCINGPQTVVVLDGLSEEPHTITVKRLSEGNVPVRLQKIEITGQIPMLLDAPPEKERRITVLGDSITCGYGCKAFYMANAFTTWEEDATEAYACLTAEALNADLQITAISGQGITRNCHGERGYLFSEIFTYDSRKHLRPYDTSLFVPDVVVINGGTNDAGGKATDEEIYIGADALLTQIQGIYPKTQIVWFYGLMGACYSTTLRALIEKRAAKGEKLHFLSVDNIYDREKDEIAANGHPSSKAQARAAETLTAFLENLMDWKN